MSEEFTNILNQISSGGTNKQVQELGLILSRTLEIVINAVDMLEANVNNLSSKIDSIEQRLNTMGSVARTATATQFPEIAPSVMSPVDDSTLESTPQSTAAQTQQNIPQSVPPQPGQVQATPAAPAAQQPPRPISPINIRRALNTEIKQLFSKMRAQSE
jgi:hypothetical protein